MNVVAEKLRISQADYLEWEVAPGKSTSTSRVKSSRWPTPASARLLTRVEEARWTEQTLDREDIVTLVCGDAQVTLLLDDLYEDTGLLA